MEAEDDTTGLPLDPAAVARARRVETQFFRDRGVDRKVRRQEVPKETNIVRVRWVDVNKGDHANPDFRSRLLAMEFKSGNGVVEWFAGTPPVEAVRLVLSVAASTRDPQGKR